VAGYQLFNKAFYPSLILNGGETMDGDRNTGEQEERSDHEISSSKPKIRKWVGLNIKFIDGHFLVSFNHDTPRIFHNMEQLLRAVEVEAGRLTVSS